MATALEEQELVQRYPWLRLPAGHIAELSARPGHGKTRLAVAAMHHTQTRGRRVAWISEPGSDALFAPDLACQGIDLSAFIHIVPASPSPYALLHAAELLLRSQAYGLLVIEIRNCAPLYQKTAWQSRLRALVRLHSSAILILNNEVNRHHSLGPLISLRAKARFVSDHRRVEFLLMKNKCDISC